MYALTVNRMLGAFSAVVALALFAASTAATAQATRTWVSGVGDDVNPCSRTAPCKTWAGAISKTAIGGEIDALDSGGFGGLTITKSLTIDGGPGQIAGVLVSGTNGITINAGIAGNVILRNLSIMGLKDVPATAAGLSGILVLTAAQVTISNVEIGGFGVAGIRVAPSAGSPVNVMVENTRLINNATGLAVDGTNAAATVRLSNSNVQQNTTGLAVTGGGSIVSFNNNRLIGNGTDGAPTLTVYQR